MKRRLTLTLWFVGSSGAVLWTCLWTVAMIYMPVARHTAPFLILVGVVCAWQGFKTFQEERRSSR